MMRRLAAAALFLALAVPALAQSPFPPGPPPPVPALPDNARQTTYTISGTTCACAVNFQLYQDGTDVDAWIQVWIGGKQYLSTDPTFGWSISSPTGGLATIPRPITDAVLTFNNAQTGTVIIVGAQRPRRLTEFTEGQGIPARAHNQALNSLFAIERELWDKTNDLTGRGLFFAPGNQTGPMPAPSACASNVLGFDNTGLKPVCFPFGASGPLLNTVDGAGATSVTNGTSGGVLYDNGGKVAAGGAVNAQALDYQIASSDCFGVVLETGAFKTITLPSLPAAGFPANGCPITITNSSTTRGQKLSGFPNGAGLAIGCGGQCLMPGQSSTVGISGGAWIVIRPAGIWNNPSALVIHADPSGSDSANDGLASGSAAFATIQHAWNVSVSYINPNGGIQLDCSATYNENLTLVGNFFGAHQIQITGNPGSPAGCIINGGLSSPTQMTVNCTDYCTTTLNGVTLEGGNPTVRINQHSTIDFNHTVFAACATSGSGGIQLLAQKQGGFNFAGPITWASAQGCAGFIQVSGAGAEGDLSGQTITISPGVNNGANYIFTATNTGVISGNWVFSGDVTASKQYTVQACGVLSQGGSTYPATSSGTSVDSTCAKVY